MPAKKADLDRAAATYWISVANKASAGTPPALKEARKLLKRAGAQLRGAGAAAQPVLNGLQAPPLDRPGGRRMKP
jgi:hypothetical protein